MTLATPHVHPTRLSAHAIQSFVKRCFPPSTQISYEEATRRLHAIRSSATFEDEIDDGQGLWRGREPGSSADVLLVVKNGLVQAVLTSWHFERGSLRDSTKDFALELAARVRARAKERRTGDYPDNLANDMLADMLDELAKDISRAAQATCEPRKVPP